ncbi:MAG: hypothetical protein MK103_10785 [Planctomycetes bacterium]|nr:hypothetical protein [Planctomycetota bacterium]
MFRTQRTGYLLRTQPARRDIGYNPESAVWFSIDWIIDNTSMSGTTKETIQRFSQDHFPYRCPATQQQPAMEWL